MSQPRFSGRGMILALLLAPLAATAATGTTAATTPVTPAPPAVQQSAPAKPQGVLLDDIAAVVNDDVITKTELDDRIHEIKQRLAQQQTSLPPEDILRKQVLDQMVMEQLQLQAADRGGITVSDDQLNRAISNIAGRNGVSMSELPKALASQGISYASYRAEIRREMIINEVQKQAVEARIAVTPREVDQYLSRQAEQSGNDTEYHLYHILIALPANATPDETKKAEERADAIEKKLKAGADFSETAVANSDGQQALKGGDLGWRKGSELPTIFASEVLNMKPGQVSGVIKSPSGFHIVKLADTRTANKVLVTQTHARHILIRTNAIVSDEQARSKLADIRKQIENGADFAKLAEKYSDDGGSASQGGDLGWANPGQYVPQFQDAMDKLKVGEISQPFKTPFGWHIVQVLGRRKEDQTAQVQKQKAYQAIRRRKLEEQTEIWVHSLRDQAYIKYYDTQ